MKIPYNLTAAMAVEKRREHMLSAIARDLPRLDSTPIDDSKTLHIACYGPSLRDTWQSLGRPLLSMSGATRFLADRGIVPDYHIDMDPRPHKVKHITPPIPGVTYLVASVCDPIYFETLKDEKVILWHVVSTDMDNDCSFVAEHDRGQLVISSGSNIGLGAMQIGGVLGFRHFEIHGMDGSFADDGERHADVHLGKVQPNDVTWDAGGKRYRTNQIMANGVAETINVCRHYPIFCVFHGEGLTQALIREERLPNACCVDEKEKVALIRNATANIVQVLPFHGGPIKALRTALGRPKLSWLPELKDKYDWTETLREKADFNTGSISLATMLILRGLCDVYRPSVIIEVGTFIGRSTLSLQASRIYTCDKDNDCLPATDTIVTHPKTTSTEMLGRLSDAGIKADLFFFDGRIQPPDIPLILRCSKPTTIYAFDDYYKAEKGVVNVQRLLPWLGKYTLLAPDSITDTGDQTVAVLVPS